MRFSRGCAIAKKNAKNRAAKPSNPPVNPGPGAPRPWLLAAGLYLLLVAAHVFALNDVYRFPFYCTDSAQYTATAHNLYENRGYTVRGVFNSTNPPVYPRFLAWAYSLGDDHVRSAFLAQCFVISLMVFPAYWLARRIGVPLPVALVAATAVSLLPHTIYAGIFMTEVLQFPLFLMTCYLAVSWLDRPATRSGLWLGVFLTLSLLNKLNSAVILIPLMAAAGLRFSELIRSGALGRQAAWRSALTPFGVLAGCQAVWTMYKLSRGGSSLGMYGTILDSFELNFGSFRAVPAYLSDFVMAAGLVCVVPGIYYLWRTWGTNRAFVLFAGGLLAIQVVYTGYFDGRDGQVRERLMSYSLPLFSILAVRGYQMMVDAGRRRYLWLMACVPFALLPLISLAIPRPPGGPEHPWAYTFGSGWITPDPRFDLGRFLWTAVGAVVLGLIVTLVKPSVHGAMRLAVFTLVFHASVFASLALRMKQNAATGLYVIGPTVAWFQKHGVGVGAKLTIVQPPAPWEPPRVTSDPRNMLSCAPGKVPSNADIWHMEAYFRWDVRTTCDSGELLAMTQPKDFVLARQDLRGLPHMVQVATYAQAGYILYRRE